MTSYSAWRLLCESFGAHKGWTEAWRKPSPQRAYDVVIIGGGGHGLAAAYYLAKEHGVRNIAVLEKGNIGGGNAGRNTTIVRSDYWTPEEAPFYKKSVDMWNDLSQELNFNVMFSRRGAMSVFHSESQRAAAIRQANAMQMNGVEAKLLTRQQVLTQVPLIHADNARYPVLGAIVQPGAGCARHDAVVWGYARAADSYGVDIIEQCEVKSIERDQQGAAVAVDTTRGRIIAGKIGISVAGNSGQLAAMVDMRLPVESHCLQAFVTESVKPVLDTVVMFGVGHFYISQSAKGGLVFGGKLEGYNSYAQRGNLPQVEDTAEAAMLFMPGLSKARLLRHWGGVVDMSMDGAPIMGPATVKNLFFNGGWCYGGFKATPAAGWCFAHTVATGESHPLSAPFSMSRFAGGRVIDAYGAGPAPNHQ